MRRVLSAGWAELRKPAEDVQIPTGKSRKSSLYVEGAEGDGGRGGGTKD